MIKNILFTSLLLAITVVFLGGCKKEKISPTQAELTANELQSVIKNNGIKRIYPVSATLGFPGSFPVGAGTGWSFSNGFIYIYYNSASDGYNLSYLVRHGIANVILSNGSSAEALLLYFEQ
jgi:hypothetical protein